MGTRSAWWVPRENSFFRETLGESVAAGPRIGVFWASGSASLPETGAKHMWVRLDGCCRGTMWVPCRVGGYPGKTRFLGRPVGTKSGVAAGGVLTRCLSKGMTGSSFVAYETGAKHRGATPWVL